MTTLNQEIIKSGLKKVWLANKARITPSELSHILTGRRKTTAYIKKEKEVRNILKKFGRV